MISINNLKPVFIIQGRQRMKHFYFCLFYLALLSYAFDFREVQAISQTSRIINTLSNKTFMFDRTQDNSYSQTLYQSIPVPSNASVTLIFPTVYTLPSNVTCLSIIIDNVAVNTFSCSVTNNSVSFLNVFNSISNLLVGKVVITVGNIMNPSPAITIGNFSGYVGNDYAVPLGASVIQLLPGALQGCSITFTPGFVNLASSVMIATMTPSDPHPPGTTLTIQFPRNTWTNDISNQQLPITSTMTCTNYSANIGSGIQCVGAASSNLISVSNLFSTTVDSTFSFGISNFLSPPSNQPSDAIIITTFLSGSRLDTCTVFPTGLSPIAFTNFSATTPAPTVMRINTLVPLRFAMIPPMAINQSDYFSITFPTGTSYSFNQVFGTGYYISPPTFSGQTVLIYHNTGTSASSYPRNTLYSLTFQSFQAPPSTLTTAPLTFQILRNGFPIMFGTTTFTAVNANLNATVTVANPIVWANTSYTFTINISNPLTAQGMIRVTFPSTVSPPRTQTNCASLIGINLNTLPTCAFDAGSNSITLSNINATSTVTNIPAQNGISLTIHGIVNPPDTATSGSFTITTFHTSNTLGVVDVGTIAGVTSTPGTISINTISVVPSSYVVMDTGVTYDVNFNNTYLIPVGGIISLHIPTDIFIVTASLPGYCRLSINGSNYFPTTCSSTTTNTSYQITFSTPAQSSSIPANSFISLRILSLCTNPTNTRIITPFLLFVNSSNAAIENRTTGITVQMLTPAQFSTTQVTRASPQNSALNSYTITLKQDATLPAGSLLLLNIPTQLVFTVNSRCTDLAGANLTCTQGSFRSMQITLNFVLGNTLFGVIISNIRNPPSYRPTATNFTFETKTGDLVNSFATGTFSTPFVNSIPSLFQQVNHTYTPGQYGSSETLNLIVTPSAFITPRTLIVEMARSFTIQNLTCGSQTGFTAACSPLPPYSINISGTLGSSQMRFSISGFTSPTFAPSDYTFISSYDSNGFLIDQNTTTIIYAITCQIPCQSCTSNLTACLSCYTNTNITNNIYLFSLNNSCLTACPTGFFASVNFRCTSCSATCLTCISSSSNCTSCNASSAYPALNITGGSGACLSACPIFFYLSTSLSPSQCTPCVPPCLTCTSFTACLSCLPGSFFYNMTCSSTCPPSITIANNGSWNCDACSPQCATCNGTISTCVTCSASAAFHQGSCVTQCPFPLVISSGICANCSTSCQGCSLVSFNCTSCSSSSALPFLFTTNTSLGSCLNRCPFTYYADTAQGLCRLCSSLSINCTNCSSTTTCFNCDFGSGLVFHNAQCLSTTPTGFYNDSGIAVPCNSTCSSCLNATYCTACVSLSLSNFRCVINCPTNQVSVSRVCVNCTFPCLTCSSTQNNCTSCNSTIADPYYLLLGSCLRTCPNYTFPNSNGWVCSSCISPCEMCSTNASCITCANGFNLFNQTCSVDCPSGFIGLNKICVPCTNNCSKCSGSTSFCLACISGNYLYNTTFPTCSPTCPIGLYPNNLTQSCTGCVSPCSTCSGFANNCTFCITGLLQNFQCVTGCSSGFYALGNTCVPCNSNCTQCTSATICTSCLSPLVLSGNTCVTTCPASTPIVNSANRCSSCTDPFCLNCSSLNFCFQCFYPRLYFQGACLTDCPYNYAADINYTTCVYSPVNPSATNATLSSTLATSSVFPVPFSIGAAFLIVACFMSKFQHERTDIIGSLYALWGVLEWGAIVFLLLYYLKIMGVSNIFKLSYLLVAGGLAWIYLINILFIFIQGYSLKKNKRFNLWLQGSVNTCWFGTVSCICLLTTGKFKFILFCKLFNFRSLSAKLDNVGGLRSLHAYAFSSILASVATIAGGIFFIIDFGFTVNQLLMAYVDVIVLSLLELVLAICNVRKQADFFQDIDEDGLIINKRIQIRQQDPPSGVMPSFIQSDRHEYGYKALQSAKKLQASYLSQLTNRKSLRDISIQAQSILGERSLISRLGTQQISDLSLFQQQDVSIQMDPIRNVQDASIAASERGGKHDVSIGQSVIFMDASVYVDKVSQKDVSIDQTQKFQQEASVQMEPQHCEISIQIDDIQQNERSVQYVPIYTDQTVQMSRQEEQLGIQCNADHQNISIQYSAKPLIQQVDEALRSETSFSVGEPSDLDLQRKLVQHPTAPQETGMKVQLELDIQEKLERKKLQLQKLQAQRKQRERQEAIRAFHGQSQTTRRQIQVQMQGASLSRQHHRNQKRDNNFFNNQYSNTDNNLVNSQEELTLNLQEQLDKKQKALQEDQQQRQLQEDLQNFKKKNPVQQSSLVEQKQLNAGRRQQINNNSSVSQNKSISIDIHQKIQQKRSQQMRKEEQNKVPDERQINIFFNNDRSNPSSLMQTIQNAQNEPSRVKTQQQFLQMLSGNNQQQHQQQLVQQTQSKEYIARQQPVKVKFQTANNIIQNHEQIIEDEDFTELFEPLQQNSYENHVPSVQKSRSTGVLTRRPPLPTRLQSNALQSSQNSIEKSVQEQDEIMNRPINPKRQFHIENRIFKKQELQKGNKTSLTQFLQKKNQGTRQIRRNNLMQDQDALTKEIQNEYRQKPLPAPKLDAYGSEQSFASHKMTSRPKANQNRKQSQEQPQDLLAVQARKSLNRGPNQLPRSKSRKQMESQVIIQINKPRTRGYLRDTYTSEEKKKSLEKIYLNKATKK